MLRPGADAPAAVRARASAGQGPIGSGGRRLEACGTGCSGPRWRSNGGRGSGTSRTQSAGRGAGWHGFILQGRGEVRHYLPPRYGDGAGVGWRAGISRDTVYGTVRVPAGVPRRSAPPVAAHLPRLRRSAPLPPRPDVRAPAQSGLPPLPAD